jgi:hypothetical protein
MDSFYFINKIKLRYITPYDVYNMEWITEEFLILQMSYLELSAIKHISDGFCSNISLIWNHGAST